MSPARRRELTKSSTTKSHRPASGAKPKQAPAKNSKDGKQSSRPPASKPNKNPMEAGSKSKAEPHTGAGTSHPEQTQSQDAAAEAAAEEAAAARALTEDIIAGLFLDYL